MATVGPRLIVSTLFPIYISSSKGFTHEFDESRNRKIVGYLSSHQCNKTARGRLQLKIKPQLLHLLRNSFGIFLLISSGSCDLFLAGDEDRWSRRLSISALTNNHSSIRISWKNFHKIIFLAAIVEMQPFK